MNERMMDLTQEEMDAIEAYLAGESIELDDIEESALVKDLSRAERRKTNFTKDRRKKGIYNKMSEDRRKRSSMDFWDAESGSHGRSKSGAVTKSFLKRRAAKAARKNAGGSGKSGYKKAFDPGWAWDLAI